MTSLEPHPGRSPPGDLAGRIAADWRAAGLEVDLVEHASAGGSIEGYVLTGRSPTRTLGCVCWPRAAAEGSGAGPAAWVIEAWLGPRGDGPGTPRERLRSAGFAVAPTEELAWARLHACILGEATLGRDLDAELAGLPGPPAPADHPRADGARASRAAGPPRRGPPPDGSRSRRDIPGGGSWKVAAACLGACAVVAGSLWVAGLRSDARDLIALGAADRLCRAATAGEGASPAAAGYWCALAHRLAPGAPAGPGDAAGPAREGHGRPAFPPGLKAPEG